MSFLSHAPPLGGLSPPHGSFQESAAHTLELSKVLSSKGSMGTCIPKGVTTFFHTASRRTERTLEGVGSMPQLGPGIFPGDDTDKLGQHPLIGRIGVGHQHGTFAVKRRSHRT